MTSMQDKKRPYRFGEKLRTVRERKGLTLKIVAKEAGVSESLVSQIERNRVSPAIDTLLTLADVLDVNLEFLFEEYRKNRPVNIVRADERRTIDEGEVIYEEISKPFDNNDTHAMESYLVEIPVNGKTHRGSYGHQGREMGFIIQGNAKLQYESKFYDLAEGDSITFSANAPHILSNCGSCPLKALWVVTPPQRFI
ncbi:MAG: cupin domain-containing protein [Treponema brennaborense]|nr:cupin domain-containing protein [Treponema brennaborense]